MTGDPVLYSAEDGVLVLDERHLRAFVDRARGLPTDHVALARLHEHQGPVVDGGIDAPIRGVAATLAGRGRRLRLLVRQRGRVTVSDAAIGDDGVTAALLLRPPGSDGVHLRLTTAGGLRRHLARRLGLGAPVPANGGPGRHRRCTTGTRSGGRSTPRSRPGGPPAVATRRCSTCAGRRIRPPRARTALLVARLDAAVAEGRPGDVAGTYVVSDAAPVDVWSRLSALTTAAPVAPAAHGWHAPPATVGGLRRARPRCGWRPQRRPGRSGGPASGRCDRSAHDADRGDDPAAGVDDGGAHRHDARLALGHALDPPRRADRRRPWSQEAAGGTQLERQPRPDRHDRAQLVRRLERLDAHTDVSVAHEELRRLARLALQPRQRRTGVEAARHRLGHGVSAARSAGGRASSGPRLVAAHQTVSGEGSREPVSRGPRQAGGLQATRTRVLGPCSRAPSTTIALSSTPTPLTLSIGWEPYLIY